jgi:hypothetical protein
MVMIHVFVWSTGIEDVKYIKMLKKIKGYSYKIHWRFDDSAL